MRGGFEIEQRDFGMEPVSIGGVVKVADEVGIAFEVFAAPGGTARERQDGHGSPRRWLTRGDEIEPRR